MNEAPNAIWPTNNEYGIPLLSLSLCADAIDEPVIAWGSKSRKSKWYNGTIHFYVDDYRFSRVWREPNQILMTEAPTVVEPNFSVGIQSPMALAIWNTYKKRYLARYWQSKGVRVVVDMNVPAWAQEVNMLGVPTGWSAFSTRGSNDDLPSISRQVELAQSFAGNGAPMLFIVYGGGKDVKKFCMEYGLIWIDEEMNNGKTKRV